MRFVKHLAAVAAVVGLSSVAGAATTYNTQVPGGFQVGSGIANEGFVVSTSDTNDTVVALGGHGRFSGPTYLSQQIDGKTVYTVPAGAYPGSSQPLALWNFNFAAKGTYATATLVVDFDPTAGTNFVEWSTATSLPALGSQNLGFNYWDLLAGSSGPVFNVNDLGDYDMTLSVYDSTGALLNSVSATYRVQAVPVPAAAVAGFALLGGIGAFRRVRRQA